MLADVLLVQNVACFGTVELLCNEHTFPFVQNSPEESLDCLWSQKIFEEHFSVTTASTRILFEV